MKTENRAEKTLIPSDSAAQTGQQKSRHAKHAQHTPVLSKYIPFFLAACLFLCAIATSCETAPEHPAAGDTTPSAEATNSYPDTDTAGTVDTAQTEKPSQTAPQTTAPADTQDPVMELTPEQIRDEILEWDGVADFQDETIYTTFAQLSEFQNVRQFYNIAAEIQNRDFEDDVKHIKIGEVVIDMACADADDGFGYISKEYCITAVTTRGQTVSFENHPLSLCYPNGFYILETGDITLIGHGPHTGNWWFINDSGFVTDLREGISEYSREGYVYGYNYDENNTLCYIRMPKKFVGAHTMEWILDSCVSPDELYLERGTVNFDADGKPVYTVVSTETVGIDSLEEPFNILKDDVTGYWGYFTLDDYLAHNATIYEYVK